MSAIVTTIHIIICFILIIAVLLQSGKSADLAGAFGGGGSQTAFGPRGAATILSKATTISAVLFMLTSLGLWILSARGTKSVIRGEEPPKKEVPAMTETKKKTESDQAQTQEQDKKPPEAETQPKETGKEKKEQ